jgi:glycosyltransferase involved in cell wall biosynthesis
VVSDIAANRPWIKHGANGLLCPVGDAEALARALERAFADPDLRARAAATNRQAVLERGDLFALGAQLARALERSINGAS